MSNQPTNQPTNQVFWFNIIVVFILVRFGPAIMHEQLEICTGTIVRAIPHLRNSTVKELIMEPYDENDVSHTGGYPFESFVDYW